MKKCLLFLSLVALLSACKRGDNSVDYTPSIAISRDFYIFRTDSVVTIDTLHLKDTLGHLELDTTHVGDTVIFMAGLSGIANDLVKFTMDWDSTYLRVLPLSIDSVNAILSQEQLAANQAVYYFKPGLLAVALPVLYAVIGVGETTPELTMTLETKSAYPTTQAKVFLPVALPDPTAHPSR